MKNTILILIGIILITSCKKNKERDSVGISCPSFNTEILAPEGYEINTISEIDFNGRVRSFQFVSQNIGYVLANNNVGSDVYLLKTTDGGENWIELNTTYSQRPLSMVFKNENSGIVTVYDTEGCPPPNCPYKCVMLLTEDGGLTWEEVETSNLQGSLCNPKYDREGNLYANLMEGETSTMKSTDGGKTWNTLFSHPMIGSYLDTYIFEIYNNQIYIGTTDEKMLVIDTEGVLINTFKVNRFEIDDFEIIDENNFVAASSQDVIKSTNGGETWEVIYKWPGRTIGFDSVDIGLILQKKDFCWQLNRINSVIAATNNGGVDWAEAEEATTHLLVTFSNSQKMGEGIWYIMASNVIMEIKKI